MLKFIVFVIVRNILIVSLFQPSNDEIAYLHLIVQYLGEKCERDIFSLKMTNAGKCCACNISK